MAGLVAAAACGSSEHASHPGQGGGGGQAGEEDAGGQGGGAAAQAGSAGSLASAGVAGAAGAAGDGTSGDGGAAGAGGAPALETLKVADKIDLLFMIDNSVSMGDKQQVLEQAVPVLLRSLITPHCLDVDGNVVGQTDTSGVCLAGTPEYAPVSDIHIGIISSSLGAHGGQVCSSTLDDHLDDQAHLIALER
ncbi:MAG TPA: hypothetical protein VGP93_02945, partial [Polyangiaceae bacterium]|nr:hypothetical protein [Polyangiaceae bacterium]